MKLPIWFQRAEAAAILAVVLYAYQMTGGNWLWFVILWLAVDLSMLGYVFGSRIGAVIYNLGHSFALPAILAAVCLVTRNPVMIDIALIWTAHITIDRMLGYGLKETTGFSQTHLGEIGPKRSK